MWLVRAWKEMSVTIIKNRFIKARINKAISIARVATVNDEFDEY